MNLRLLAWLPLVLPLCLFVALGEQGSPLAVGIVLALSKLLAAWFAAYAAGAFERGDYLRGAWRLSALSMAFLFVRDALMLSGLAALLPGRAVVLGGLVLACNVSAVISLWRMSRLFQAAGLASEETTAHWGLYTFVAMALAGLVTFPSFVLSVDELRRGEPSAVFWLFSAAGDVLSLSFVAPILLTAVAMRGGLLIWPFALLTASIGAWLLYDSAGLFRHFALATEPEVLRLEQLFSCIACLYSAAAGLAQRWVVRG